MDKVDFVNKYVKDCISKNILPIMQEVSYLLDVDDNTLVEWGKKHNRFGAATRKLMAAQATMLQRGIYDDSRQHGSGGIFLLKNNHGFRDRTETDITSGGEKLPTPIMCVNPNVYTDHSNKENSESKTED